MASRWPGIRSELNLDIAWRFAFVPTGTRTEPSAGAVYLDVGGDLRPGVIDHHQGEAFACSAARLVLRHPQFVYDHLAASLRADLANGLVPEGRPWRPTLVTHHAPDFDSIVCVHLCRHLVERGDFPDHAEDLVAYADEVDQGRRALSADGGDAELYPLILMLATLGSSENSALLQELARYANATGECSSERMLEVGLGLVDLWVESRGLARERAQDRRPSKNDGMDLALRADHPIVAPLRRELARDRSTFHDLLASGRVLYGTKPVDLPRADGRGSHPIAVAFIPDLEACALNKLYLRAGIGGPGPAPLTVIRTARGPERAPTAWLIAVDPRAAVDDAVSLRGLGAALETAEQDAREARGGRDPRRGVARFPEYPRIADPWYDGRGHDFTIVDAPRAGSALGRAEIEAILRSPFWEPKVGAVRIERIGGAAGPAPGTIRCARLDELRAKVDDERRVAGKGSSGERLLVAAEISRSWGSDAIDDFADRVTGGVMRKTTVDGCEVALGRLGCLVSIGLRSGGGKRLDGAFERIARLLAPTVRLLEEMQRIETDLERCVVRLPLRVVREHVRTDIAFRREFAEARGADDHELARSILDAFEVEAVIERVGRLLEHRDDDARRRRDAALNRVVFVVGLLGVVEATRIAIDGGSAILGLPSEMDGWPWYVAVAPPVAFILVVLMAFASLSTRGSGWIARLLPRLPQIHHMLFDDIDVEDRLPENHAPGVPGQKE